MEYILILCKWFICSSVIWHIIEKKKRKICNHPNNNMWRFEESSKASAGGDWCQTELNNIEILSFSLFLPLVHIWRITRECKLDKDISDLSYLAIQYLYHTLVYLSLKPSIIKSINGLFIHSTPSTLTSFSY